MVHLNINHSMSTSNRISGENTIFRKTYFNWPSFKGSAIILQKKMTRDPILVLLRI